MSAIVLVCSVLALLLSIAALVIAIIHEHDKPSSSAAAAPLKSSAVIRKIDWHKKKSNGPSFCDYVGPCDKPKYAACMEQCGKTGEGMCASYCGPASFAPSFR